MKYNIYKLIKFKNIINIQEKIIQENINLVEIMRALPLKSQQRNFNFIKIWTSDCISIFIPNSEEQ